MTKKTYEAPMVKKVSLDVKNAVLAVCHSSTVLGFDEPCGYQGKCAYPRI